MAQQAHRRVRCWGAGQVRGKLPKDGSPSTPLGAVSSAERRTPLHVPGHIAGRCPRGPSEQLLPIQLGLCRQDVCCPGDLTVKSVPQGRCPVHPTSPSAREAVPPALLSPLIQVQSHPFQVSCAFVPPPYVLRSPSWLRDVRREAGPR